MKNRVLVTGGTGFIGSHICDALIELGNEVVCFDNQITSSKENIEHLEKREGFHFVKGDIRDLDSVEVAMEGCTHVCHQAALGSVPRSIDDPIRSTEINLIGGLNLLCSSNSLGVKRFVFASSSSVYGDDSQLPKVESRVGNPLSPYAASKASFEDYARVFFLIHGMETIGLRYFNVFGPRQSPNGAYAAVIPKFIDSIQKGESPIIFGDGLQTRDFTYVKNVVDANLRALFGGRKRAFGECFNVACGDTVSINQLFMDIRASYEDLIGSNVSVLPEHKGERAGDVRDSLADLEKIKDILGYSPGVSYLEGIRETVTWFISGDE